MKKLLIGSLLTVCVASSIVSCNNGAYDANPGKDNQGALNPLDTSIAGIIYIGTMKGIVNGGELIFSPAYFSIDPESGTRHVWGRVQNDSVYWRTITMTVDNELVKGKKNDTVRTASFTYSVYDTVRKVHKKYTQTPTNTADFHVVMVADENNTMRGYFNGFVKNTEPVIPTPNPNDIVTFKKLNFYLDNKPFKK